MQINSSPRFIKNFTIGLIASSVGTFVALPSTAMPDTGESVAAPEAVEETTVESSELESSELLERLLEGILTPSSAEGLLIPEATVEADTTEAAEEDVADTAETEEAVAEEPVESGTINAVDGNTEADAEMMDETVEADAEMIDGAVEADAEMTDETLVEGATDESVETEAAAEAINTEEFTIAELTNNSDSFTILAAALEAADLTEVLSQEGPYTVFAPTDEAFEALPIGTVEQLLLPENKDVLVKVLTYHVVPGAVLSTDLESGNVATVEGSDLTVEVGDTVTVNNANVLVADVQASNGVIHIIDRVIVPFEPAAGTEVESPEPIQ